MKRLQYKHKAIHDYHNADSRLHHHTAVVAIGIALLASMLAWNFGSVFQPQSQTYAAQEVDMSIVTNVYPSEFQNGQDVAVLLYYATAGGSLSGVDITVDLPTQLVFQSSNIAHTSIQNNGSSNTYSFDNLPNDTDVIVLQTIANGPVGWSGSITGSITTSQVGVTDTNGNNNQDNAQVSIIASPVVELGADLQISQSADTQTAIIGQNIVYTINYENLGPENADATYIFAVLPEGLSYLSATPSPNQQDGNALRRDIASLASGVNDSISITTNVSTLLNSGFTLYNFVSIDSVTPDPAAANNTAGLSIGVNGGLPDLVVSKIANRDEVQVGEDIVYTYVFENNGLGLAQNVTLSDTFPEDVVYVDSSLEPSISEGSYVWNLSDMAPDVGGVIQLTVRPTQAGTLNQLAFISSDTTDADMTNNTNGYAVTVLGDSTSSQEDDETTGGRTPTYYQFPPSVCLSPTGVCDHHAADNQAQEQEDDEITEIQTDLPQEYVQAYTYAQSLGFASAQQPTEQRLFQNMTRHELAKLMVLFVNKELGRKPDVDKSCIFTDSSTMPEEVRFYTTKACQYGLMGIGIAAFDPLAPIDRATVGTVFSRALFGSMFDRHTDDRYSEHLRVLRHLSVMKRIDNYTESMLYGDALLMAYRLADTGLASKIAQKLYNK